MNIERPNGLAVILENKLNSYLAKRLGRFLWKWKMTKRTKAIIAYILKMLILQKNSLRNLLTDNI